MLTLDVGGYVFTSGVMTSEIAGAHISNAYRIPNLAIDVQCVGTNKTPIATYRGAGQHVVCRGGNSGTVGCIRVNVGCEVEVNPLCVD